MQARQNAPQKRSSSSINTHRRQIGVGSIVTSAFRLPFGLGGGPSKVDQRVQLKQEVGLEPGTWSLEGLLSFHA